MTIKTDQSIKESAMKNLSILILVLLSFLISNCEKNSENKQTSCFQLDLDDPTGYDLTNKWIFLGIIYQSRIELCKPENLKEMNIEFNDTNYFSGASACNSIFGNYYTSNPDSIIIERLLKTMIFCMNDTVREWEEKYCTGLRYATNFDILGNRLKIRTNASYDLIFRAD